jgi:UDP-N-acetylmuramate: L-alanyl-gamma-D-glutamyl-meso-diaminopimelate ligase
MTRGNPLVEALLDSDRPYVSGPQWLAENVLRDKWALAVAGTHGKTTVASMLAFILDRAGLAPGFLIGGVPVDFGVSARLTESRWFVIEADEYDTAFFDKRSKFVHYRSRTAILNNLEYDHADIFPDLAAIEAQFHHFVRTIPHRGRIIVNGGEASLERVLARGVWSEVERFAETGSGGAAEWTVDSAGEVRLRGEAQRTLALSQPGRHNRLNALAAVAAANHVGVAARAAIDALAAFEGVRRRLEVRGRVRGVTVYDDFAHHPTAIAATLEALRGEVGAARIVAVLEPRSNTMKQGTMKAALPGSLEHADRVFCYANELGWDVAAALAPLGNKAEVHREFELLVDAIVSEARAGDHVLVMSNGGFGGIHERLIARLGAR